MTDENVQTAVHATAPVSDERIGLARRRLQMASQALIFFAN